MSYRGDWYDPTFFKKIYYSNVSKLVSDKFHRFLEKNREDNFPITLELAATHGQHLDFVKHTYNSYILSDFIVNETLIAKSREKLNVSVMTLDVRDLTTLDQDSIDRIVVTCLLHHLTEVPQALEQMIRVLKAKTGVIDILLPNDPSLIWNLGRILFTVPRVLLAGKTWREYWKYVDDEHVNNINQILMDINEAAIQQNLKISYSKLPFNHAPRVFTFFTRVSITKPGT
jgi:ubiquinone/menaquinone biosynthesis C-methylase UbiE